MSNQQMIELVIRSGPNFGQKFTLRGQPQTIGRSAENDIMIDETSISRRHARLSVTPRGVMIEDLGSSNGTFVNAMRVTTPTLLNSGDTIQLGDKVRLSVQTARDADVTHAAAVTRQTSPASKGTNPLLWVGLGIVVALIILGGGYVGLSLLRDTEPTAPPPTGVAQAVTVVPTETALPSATPISPETAVIAPDIPAATPTERVVVMVATSEPATETPIILIVTPSAAPATDTSLPPSLTPVILIITPTAPPPTPTTAATAKPTAQPTTVTVGAAPLGIFQDFERDSSWQRGDEPYGEFARTSSQSYSGSYAGQLTYNFPTANNDYVVFKQSRELSGSPNAITAWVYGDGAGHFLNVWIKDAGGQTWSMSFGQIKHNGWQEMTAYLDSSQPWPSGHVSGPNNGVIDYPISFQALVLDDGADTYSGSGSIYIDNLTSRAGGAAPQPTSTPAPQIVATTAPATNYYTLEVSKHVYEPWGAPVGDLCEALRTGSFNDKVPVKAFNIELLLTNNSTVQVADNWMPVFITAQGQRPRVCDNSFYAGNGPPPGGTSSVTFYTQVAPDDYVSVIQLTVNDVMTQICLNDSGAQVSCSGTPLPPQPQPQPQPQTQPTGAPSVDYCFEWDSNEDYYNFSFR